MQIFVKLIMGKAKLICFLNLKSLSKNASKQRAGSSCCITQEQSAKKHIKTIEIYAEESGVCWFRVAKH